MSARRTCATEGRRTQTGITAGYSGRNRLERMVRDGRMFTIGGGTAQILRTVVASQILGRKLPQTRDGHLKLAEREAADKARGAAE